MAQIANAVSYKDIQSTIYATYLDSITRVSMYETPFVTFSGEPQDEIGNNGNTLLTWDTQSVPQTTDANIGRSPGDTLSPIAATVPSTISNYHQATQEDMTITKRATMSKGAGSGRMVQQMIVRGFAMRRGIEKTALSLQDADNGLASTNTDGKTKSAGAFTFCTNNYNHNGSNWDSGEGPRYSGNIPIAPTLKNKSPRTVTISDLDNFLTTIFNGCGATPHLVMTSPDTKSSIMATVNTKNSQWSSVTQHHEFGPSPVKNLAEYGSVDLINTTSGVIALYPNVHMDKPTADEGTQIFFMHPADWQIHYNAKYQVLPMATTGLNQKSTMYTDWAIVCRNPLRSGVFSLVSAVGIGE